MNEKVDRTEVRPICPYCKQETAMSLRIDPLPDVASYGVTTFSCSNCRSVLAMCWTPRDLAMELSLDKIKPQ